LSSNNPVRTTNEQTMAHHVNRSRKDRQGFMTTSHHPECSVARMRLLEGMLLKGDHMAMQYLVGMGLVGLGAGIAVNAVLGPLALGVIRFHNSPNAINQLIGGEIVSLVVVAPLSLAAGVLWMRGQKIAPVLALAPSLYALYTYTTEILGPEYGGRYPGNNEQFLPLHAGILALSAWVAAKAWAALEEGQLLMPRPHVRLTAAAALFVPSALFALAWMQQIVTFAGGERSQAYQDDPRLWWLIKALDLGLLIPATLVASIGLLRARPVGLKLAYGLTGFLACLTGSVGGMGAVMLWKGDPSASPMMLIIALAAALGLGGVATQLIRSYAVRNAPHEEHLLASPGLPMPTT